MSDEYSDGPSSTSFGSLKSPNPGKSMPRSAGTYTLPPGHRAVNGQDFTEDNFNTPLDDIAEALTDSVPRDGTAAMTGPLNMGSQKITSLANGEADTDAITKKQAEDLLANVGVFVGQVVAAARSSTPTGWLLCDGTAVSRTTYSGLFAVIGTTFGTGNGTTTFNLPDLRGEFIRGLDNGRSVDTGRGLGTAQAAATAAHNHTATSVVTDPGHLHNVGFQLTGLDGGPAGIEIPKNYTGVPYYTTSTSTTGITVATTVANSTGVETRPRNVALNYFIKT